MTRREPCRDAARCRGCGSCPASCWRSVAVCFSSPLACAGPFHPLSQRGCFHVRYSSTHSATQIRGSLPICPLLALLGKQLPFLGQGGASRFFVLIWQGCPLGARLCSWESSRVPSPAACSKIKAVPASRWQCLPTPLRGRPARGGGFRPPAPDARRPAVLG